MFPPTDQDDQCCTGTTQRGNFYAPSRQVADPLKHHTAGAHTPKSVPHVPQEVQDTVRWATETVVGGLQTTVLIGSK